MKTKQAKARAAKAKAAKTQAAKTTQKAQLAEHTALTTQLAKFLPQPPQTVMGAFQRAPKTMDAVALLKADHRKVEGLFKQFEQADSDDNRHRIAEEICDELNVHTMIEEEIFYPACREHGVDMEMMDEAQVEHDAAKVLITELMTLPPDSEYYHAKVKVLSEYIHHHILEEEKPKEGMFARAKASGVDLDEVGQELQACKQELMARVKAHRMGLPKVRAFYSEVAHEEDEEEFGPEREERGRYMSEDEDYEHERPRGRAIRPQMPERDEHGRFMSEEDEDREREGRRGRGGGGGWEERTGVRARGSHRREEDYEERRPPSRHGGWFGDPEGHARASHRGWERREEEYDERRPMRSREGGGSRRYEDYEERRSSRSSSRGERHGGWFGDPRGHAEAARRGWQHRED